jgi:hypothetical protein
MRKLREIAGAERVSAGRQPIGASRRDEGGWVEELTMLESRLSAKMLEFSAVSYVDSEDLHNALTVSRHGSVP